MPYAIFFFFKLNSRCSGFINICYSDQLLGYKTSFIQQKKKKRRKKKTYTKLKCTQIHLFSELSIAEKIPLKSNAAKGKKKKGFRVELRAKSNFKSNAPGKLRQTIYFFWSNLHCNSQEHRTQWRSHWGCKGGRMPPLTAKKIAKIAKKRGEIRKNQDNRGEIGKKRQKSGRFFHFAPHDR